MAGSNPTSPGPCVGHEEDFYAYAAEQFYNDMEEAKRLQTEVNTAYQEYCAQNNSTVAGMR